VKASAHISSDDEDGFLSSDDQDGLLGSSHLALQKKLFILL
jgi:hypothetical protein